MRVAKLKIQFLKLKEVEFGALELKEVCEVCF